MRCRLQVGEVARFGDISGQVVKVGWLMTDVRESSTLALVSVPNANIMSSGVSIETFNTHRKVKQRFTIPYDAVDKVESIIADVQQAYQEIE